MEIYATKYYSFIIKNDKFHEINYRINKSSKDYTLPFYKYCGPGTPYFYNIKNKITPTSILDELSKNHDKQYTYANADEDIINADKKFIKDIRENYKNFNKKDKILGLLIILVFKIKIKMS